MMPKVFELRSSTKRHHILLSYDLLRGYRTLSGNVDGKSGSLGEVRRRG